MRVLIVEDDENKRKQLSLVVKEVAPETQLTECRSYNSGLREVLKSSHELILLDMTMPTYDIGLEEDGGRPQHYAGRAILRQMQRHGVSTPVVIVTQYDVFGEGQDRLTRAELDEQLQREHAGNYQGTVYYNAAVEGWKPDLGRLVNRVLQSRGA